MGAKDPGFGGEPPKRRLERLLLAKSKDGKNWTKPKLGLVSYNGNTANNIVKLTGADYMAAGVIFFEPGEPDPTRRFKMVWENQGMNHGIKGNNLISFSADGLTWTVDPRPELGMEMSGCVVLDQGNDGTPKRYLISGHGGSFFPPARRMILYQSYDFETWMPVPINAFGRTPFPPQGLPAGLDPEYTYGNAGEQCHLGAALKKHPGMILGIYGQWHGHPTNDRRLTTMDLGLVVSNDGLHFREPVPDFKFVPCAEDLSTNLSKPWASRGLLAPTAIGMPANVQGNGMENVGDETLFWYGCWPEV